MCGFGVCGRPASLVVDSGTQLRAGCLAHVNAWCSRYGGYGDVVVRAL